MYHVLQIELADLALLAVEDGAGEGVELSVEVELAADGAGLAREGHDDAP
jgi:hypothetical protein